MITVIQLTITHDKPIADLIDKAAGRVYSMDGVKDCTANLIPQSESAGYRSTLTDADRKILAERTSAAEKIKEIYMSPIIPVLAVRGVE